MKKILMVENHQHFASAVIKEFLSEYQVKVVAGIAEAKVEIENYKYDYYLVDYDLDDGKGDEFVSALKKGDPLASVIAISSHDAGNKALTLAGADFTCSKMNFKDISQFLK